MTTTVQRRIPVNVPVSSAYDRWTKLEDSPHVMGNLKRVTQLGDDQLEWVARLAGGLVL